MKRLLLIVLIVLFAVLIVQAEDDAGNINDPGENERANACYEDGSLANQCDTDWEWHCGWYLIRFESGSLSHDTFPEWCESLLPPLPSSDGCYPYLDAYLFFGEGNFLPSGAPIYSDSFCTSTHQQLNSDLVYAPGGSGQATAICVENSSHTDSGFIGGNIHYCRN